MKIIKSVFHKSPKSGNDEINMYLPQLFLYFEYSKAVRMEIGLITGLSKRKNYTMFESCVAMIEINHIEDE